MTYEEAMSFIKEAEKLGSIPGLKTITDLLDRLGNPQDRLRVVHVAGTNGKGSTIAFLSGILAAAGYRAGIYISPSVFSYREKFQIIHGIADSSAEGAAKLYKEFISEKDLCKALDEIKSVCEEMVRDGQAHPTSFEIETAMIFLYMDWEQVDFLILETGMGGRLDATNVISSPVCSVITHISYDHMHFLGNTLEQIANEKAGIMKRNSCTVTCNQEPEVLKVLGSRAGELGISMTIADGAKAADIRYSQECTTFSYPSDGGMERYQIGQLGNYQVENAVLALETARKMDMLGYPVPAEAIKKGLMLARWKGRFEHIAKSPDIYVDGAHNMDGAVRLQESIEIYFTNRRLVFIIGILADKDYKGILHILAPLADTIITLTPDNHRALPSDKLAKEARAYCGRVFDEGDIEKALERACEEAGLEDVIIAFGSLSFLGSMANLVSLRKEKENG